jgi:hypothetical protein
MLTLDKKCDVARHLLAAIEAPTLDEARALMCRLYRDLGTDRAPTQRPAPNSELPVDWEPESVSPRPAGQTITREDDVVFIDVVGSEP